MFTAHVAPQTRLPLALPFPSHIRRSTVPAHYPPKGNEMIANGPAFNFLPPLRLFREANPPSSSLELGRRERPCRGQAAALFGGESGYWFKRYPTDGRKPDFGIHGLGWRHRDFRSSRPRHRTIPAQVPVVH